LKREWIHDRSAQNRASAAGTTNKQSFPDSNYFQ